MAEQPVRLFPLTPIQRRTVWPDLRGFFVLDSLQEQLASFMASTVQGFMPVAGMASLFVEVAPRNGYRASAGRGGKGDRRATPLFRWWNAVRHP